MDIDYREILRNELEQRIKRNPSYSLRAFANAVHLNPPHLSSVLNGKKGLSVASASKIAKGLKWNSDETNFFVGLVEFKHARRKVDKVTAERRLNTLLLNKSFNTIDLEEFKIISDWYDLSILQAFELDDFEYSHQWLSQAFGISTDEVVQALDRLKALGYIKLNDKGKWAPTQRNIATPTVTSSLIRHYHHQLLKKADDALDTQTIDERDFSSIVMSIDRTKLPEAKEWLKEFRRKFFTDLDKSKNKNSVYCLSIQFFKLSNNNNKLRSKS